MVGLPLCAAYIGSNAFLRLGTFPRPARAAYANWYQRPERKVKSNKHVLSRRAHRAMRKQQRQQSRRR